MFALAYGVLIWAKVDANGFNTIWRYFGWSNQTLAVFALASILIWLAQHDKKKYVWIPLIPLMFYSFVTCSYIFSAKIGFHLPITIAYVIGGIFTLLVAAAAMYRGSVSHSIQADESGMKGREA